MYSLSPEKRAILHIPPKDVTPEHAFGLLTDRFVKVFDSWIRRYVGRTFSWSAK